MNTKSELTIKSQTADDMVGLEFGKFVRHGNISILVALVVLIVAGIVIRMPITVSGETEVVAKNPRVAVVSSKAGALSDLLVADGESVARLQPLAVIGSSLTFAEVSEIWNFFYSVNRLWLEGYSRDSVLQRPEGTSEFDPICRSVEYQMKFIRDCFEDSLVLSLSKSGMRSRQILLQARAQYEVEMQAAIEKVDISRLEFSRSSQLLENGLLSLAQHESAKALLIKARQDSLAVKQRISALEFQQSELTRELTQLELNREDRLAVARAALTASLIELERKLQEWESKCLVRATTNGLVSLVSIWAPNQHVSDKDTLLFLLSADSNLVCRVFAPQSGTGSLHTGMKCNIELNAFPTEIYGSLRGEVSSISQTYRENMLLLELHIDSSMVTNMGKQIQIKQGMKGSATIVVNDVSILNRIFSRISDNL